MASNAAPDTARDTPRYRGAPRPEDEQRAARRLDAASALLRANVARLLPLAAQFQDRETIVESAIHGSSMAPAIPSGARLRVRLCGDAPCRPGDVVYYLAPGGYVVHRLLHRVSRGSGEPLLLTCGDNRLAPDAPVPANRMLGMVVAVDGASGWRPVGPAIVPGAAYRSWIRAVTVPSTLAVLYLSPAAAGWLAAGLLALESIARAVGGRLRRRWSRGTTGR